IVEGGETPDLSPEELKEIGYQIAAYPLSLMAAAMKAMVECLQTMKHGQPRDDKLMGWADLRQRIGFDDYYEVSERYASSRRDG
ncbi:MAG TPA: carboxyvinyl-carboxyphosphonate phosphorylmutase, partial [Thalassospira sp.]|nr:carboxyvinyl-carboxyphosphonate phosphorylmutase [Thalassospira sp.]